MGGLDGIMDGLGLFGGWGGGGGAAAGYIAAVVKMIYLLAARGSVPFIEANAQIGQVFDAVGRARGIYAAARQILAAPTPTTPEGWVDYANRVFTQGQQAVREAGVLVDRVGAHVGAAGPMLGALEACLATPDGGVHAEQCAGTAQVLGTQTDINALALESAQTELALQEREERETGRRLAIDASGALLGVDQALTGADKIDPWGGY